MLTITNTQLQMLPLHDADLLELNLRWDISAYSAAIKLKINPEEDLTPFNDIGLGPESEIITITFPNCWRLQSNWNGDWSGHVELLDWSVNGPDSVGKKSTGVWETNTPNLNHYSFEFSNGAHLEIVSKAATIQCEK